MALHFVEVSVLESTDGVTFTQEKQLETADERRKRQLETDRAEAKRNTRRSGVSLAQQLLENQAAAQEKWDEEHNPHQAPAGLEEDGTVPYRSQQ
jgi:hypothetical protein